MKRAILIHGWDGYPENAWFPWLRSELEKQGFSAVAPAMPNPDEPKIEEWIPALAKEISSPDSELCLVGHSVGCQAILRYLETLPAETRIAGVVLVAPWMELDTTTLEEEGEEVREIARPWMETPIDFSKIKTIAGKTTAILSDNDPYVPVSQGDIFKEKMGAEIIVESGKGHFDDFQGMKELPSALKAVEGLF